VVISKEDMTNRDPMCAGLMTMAERELSAFLCAVTELFGSEQVEYPQKTGCVS